MKKITKQQAGFTLIELIVVIVILGILAATALPRFADLGADARTASVNAARGSLSATSAMVHGTFLVRTPAPTTVVLENVTVGVVNGYPSALTVADGAGISALDYDIDTTTATIAKISPKSASTTAKAAGTCSVVYTEATATAPPSITPSTGAC